MLFFPKRLIFPLSTHYKTIHSFWDISDRISVSNFLDFIYGSGKAIHVFCSPLQQTYLLKFQVYSHAGDHRDFTLYSWGLNNPTHSSLNGTCEHKYHITLHKI